MTMRPVLRKCISCGIVSDRKNLVKITKNYLTGEICIDPDSKTFGRSVYICRNSECVQKAFKKNKIIKILKVKNADEFREILNNCTCK